MPALPSRRVVAWLAFAAIVGVFARPAAAITFLFDENFDGVPLTVAPTYGEPNAWSPVPPSGWDSATQTPPGLGIPEWRSWAIVREDFWKDFGEGRQLFDRGTNKFAVADADLWNDNLAFTGEGRGQYGTVLFSPTIDLSPRGDLEEELTLSFDVTWREVRRDPLQPFDAYEGNQTALVLARFDDLPPVELLRLESAPFQDGQGRPTFAEFDVAGNANAPNPLYQPFIPNERLHLDVQAAIDEVFGPSSSANAPPGLALATGGGAGSVGIEFVVEEGGDDGWFGVDNVQMASYEAPMDGDMYIDGVLDLMDVDEFANALLDSDEYIADWSGEFPVERGNLNGDGVFDFDDIPAFVEYMENQGAIPGVSLALARALSGVPEPSAGVLLTLATAIVLGGTRRS